MRVIGGEFRSRRLISVPGMQTRPTTDRLRETLFDVLAPRIEDAVFVDGYAGTGAVGIEAISRGAKLAIFLENNRRAVEAIRANLHTLGIENRARVVVGKVAVSLVRHAGDIVFLDPPYEQQGEYRAALEVLGATPPQLTIVQHSSRYDPGDLFGTLRKVRLLRQGDNALSFYQAASQPAAHSEIPEMV